MSPSSRPEIVKSNPIGSGLDAVRNSFNSITKDLDFPNSSEALGHINDEGKDSLQNLALDLVLALLNLPAARLLPSRSSSKNLLGDLSRLGTAVNSDYFDVERLKPLLNIVIRGESDDLIWDRVYEAVTESTPPPRLPSITQQTPWLRNTSSFANSSEQRKYVDGILKEELGPMYIGVPGFFDAHFAQIAPAAKAVFEKCQEGDLFHNDKGWQGWPDEAKEKDVLSWFAVVVSRLTELAEEHKLVSMIPLRLLAQPNQPLEGSTAERKLDIGFVDGLRTRQDSKCHWSQILIPGELKSNLSADTASRTWLDLGRYAREVLAAQDTRRFVLSFTLCGSRMRLWQFDRLGGIASSAFDIHEHGLQFASTILGFLSMDEEQLGFDPTIVSAGDQKYIEIERNGQRERLVIDQLMKKAPCVAGRATTCWKAHRQGDPSPLVIKDSWQYPEREEEGELLRDATESGVINVARYYHHETVRVGGIDDDILSNVRRGLDITEAANYRAELSLPRNSLRRGQSNVINRKRSSSQTDTSIPPSKRSCSSSPTKLGRNSLPNRIHRRIIVRDYGKPIYYASSRAALLVALEGCINGYESLHTQAGMLQCDISPANLMMNEDDDNDNPSWPSFLIDLDLAIKEKRHGFSGARGKTGTRARGKAGTRAFMAIGVLLGERHSFMHDLESFFWVLFWICIHYDRPSKERVVSRFEKWNYVDTTELAMIKKGVVNDESDFLESAEENFSRYYQPMILWVNRLRRVVFPSGSRWKAPNEGLYLDMKVILQAAQKDPKVLGEEDAQ